MIRAAFVLPAATVEQKIRGGGHNDGIIPRQRFACYSGAMPKRSRKRPKDVNAFAKSIVDDLIAITEAPPKDPAAVALGRKGGLKGGKARAERMTAAERKASASKAAAARWGKRNDEG